MNRRNFQRFSISILQLHFRILGQNSEKNSLNYRGGPLSFFKKSFRLFTYCTIFKRTHLKQILFASICRHKSQNNMFFQKYLRCLQQCFICLNTLQLNFLQNCSFLRCLRINFLKKNNSVFPSFDIINFFNNTRSETLRFFLTFL